MTAFVVPRPIGWISTISASAAVILPEIPAGLDRSTGGSVRRGLLQRATSASRMTRAQRSAKGYTRMEGAKRAASIC